MEISERARVLAPIRSLEVASVRVIGSPEHRVDGTQGGRSPHASAGVLLTLSEPARAIAAERHASGSDADSRRLSAAIEPARAAHSSGTGELTRAEEQEVRELRARDAEVRAHENAHKAAAGRHSRGGPSYEYERGPDGRQYAVGGEVSIDSSPIPGDPDATIQKMQQVRRAALAPASPSPQDRKVAAEASRSEQAARAEKLAERREQRAEGAEGGSESILDAYSGGFEDPRGENLDLQA